MSRMDERAVVKAMDDMEMERTFETVLIAGMFSVMVVIVLAQYMQGMAVSKIDITTSAYPPVAANTGLVWIQMTSLGQPNQVKIIAENSTGAFEDVLLGLTT